MPLYPGKYFPIHCIVGLSNILIPYKQHVSLNKYWRLFLLFTHQSSVSAPSNYCFSTCACYFLNILSTFYASFVFLYPWIVTIMSYFTQEYKTFKSSSSVGGSAICSYIYLYSFWILLLFMKSTNTAVDLIWRGSWYDAEKKTKTNKQTKIATICTVIFSTVLYTSMWDLIFQVHDYEHF